MLRHQLHDLSPDKSHRKEASAMSDDDYEPMDHIDWDLIDKDHTIEWLVHLCEVFNRGKVAINGPTGLKISSGNPHSRR